MKLVRSSVIVSASVATLTMSVFTVGLLATSGCNSVPSLQTTNTVHAPPTLDRAVHWTRNSAERRAVYLQTYAVAKERLRQVTTGLEPGTWAVALDGDETVIDNSLYEKELELNGQTSDEEKWAAWVERRAAIPVPGTVDFLQLVRELGGKIAIVTNRRDIHCPWTEENFEREGIPYDVILCRSPESSEKEERWQRVEHGTASPSLPPLEIVMWLGDDIRDFPNLDQKLRLDDEAAFAEFGSKYFAFPNPTYGSWRSNPHD